jgi:hypothetical protein
LHNRKFSRDGTDEKSHDNSEENNEAIHREGDEEGSYGRFEVTHPKED